MGDSPEPENNNARASVDSWVRAGTAVGTSVIAAILIGFLSSFKALLSQAPLITAYMERNTQALESVQKEQARHQVMITEVFSKYISQEKLREELEKMDKKLQDLQIKQAVLEQQQRRR